MSDDRDAVTLGPLVGIVDMVVADETWSGEHDSLRRWFRVEIRVFAAWFCYRLVVKCPRLGNFHLLGFPQTARLRCVRSNQSGFQKNRQLRRRWWGVQLQNHWYQPSFPDGLSRTLPPISS